MGLALFDLLALLELGDHALDIDDHGLRGLFRQRLQTPLRVAKSSELFEGALPCVRLVQSQEKRFALPDQVLTWGHLRGNWDLPQQFFHQGAKDFSLVLVQRVSFLKDVR